MRELFEISLVVAVTVIVGYVLPFLFAVAVIAIAARWVLGAL